jgi:glyoxylase-like metal-dependent hydrolase (beta-lactamase superfamily II)
VNLSDDLSVKEIIKDTFLITHSFPWPGNSLLVRLTKRDFIWADTPYTPEATSLVLDWLYNKFGNNINITEINTGFHIDNLGGNKEIIKRNIPVYGSELTCELIKTRSTLTMKKMENWLLSPQYKRYYDVYKSFIFYEPTILFNINEEQILQFNSERVEIFYPGPTHTYDNLVVYIPGKRILFGGCMILALETKEAGFIEDGNMEEWPKSLRRVLEKYKSTAIVVPGHGKPGDISLIEHSVRITTFN